MAMGSHFGGRKRHEALVENGKWDDSSSLIQSATKIPAALSLLGHNMIPTVSHIISSSGSYFHSCVVENSGYAGATYRT